MSNIVDFDDYFNKSLDIRNFNAPKNIIAIGQINPISGDFQYNAEKICRYIKLAISLGIKTIIFPSNSLGGHFIEDIIKRHPQVENECKKWLNGIAEISEGITVILGYINNNMAVIRDKELKEIYTEANDFCITDDKITGSKIVINFALTESKGANILDTHDKLSCAAKENSLPVIYVNSVGATDNISYIGSSAVFDNNGELIYRAKAFEEQFCVIDTEKKGILHRLPVNRKISEKFSLDYEYDLERTYLTVKQGIKDYFAKCGLKRAVLGLSGGLDSTVCAVLLADALGKENVCGISMPSEITSRESKSDAKQLAENLGITFKEAPIKQMVDVTSECFGDLFEKLENSFGGRYEVSYTRDNIQARLRAMYLYGVSNEFASCIPIATSDKSEAYMGYATINGDMSGGFAPIADITKTKLFALARWLNKNREQKDVIPVSVINKRPGAELAIDPKTGKPLCAEDALMPYEFLDEIIWRVENYGESYYEMLNSEFLYEKNNSVPAEEKRNWLDKFFRRMSSALYKWTILPPSVIVEQNGINLSEYNQPVTSGRINYKSTIQDEINLFCKEI